MKSISPIVAIVILLLMTVAAAGMAYLTITTYQSETQAGTQGGLETLSTRTRTQLKIESVSGGKIYLRNMGSETFMNPTFYVEGKLLNFTGPLECEPGKLCVYTVLENVTCTGTCELDMGEDMPVGTRVEVTEEELGGGGGGGEEEPGPYCGDINCDTGENCTSCPGDCPCTYQCCSGVCCNVNTYCSGVSCVSCVNTCNGVCLGPGCTSDPDCTSTPCCGNGVCDGSETPASCPQECQLALPWPLFRNYPNNTGYSPEVTSPAQPGVFEVRNFTTYNFFGGSPPSTPLLSDINGDNITDIAVGGGGLKVYYGINDTLVWENGAATGNQIAVTDSDDNGIAEIIMLDGSVYSFYGNNGTIIWSHYEYYSTSTYPIIADVDGDMVQDVLYGSYGNITALEADTGALKWYYEITDGESYYFAESTPAVADIDNDGVVEVVFGSDYNKVHAIYGTNGTEIWTYDTYDLVLSSPMLADLDDDGDLEIIVGSDSDYLYALFENGTLMWSYSANENNVRTDPAIADVDNNGELDVVFIGEDYIVRALYGINGTEIWNYYESDAFSISSPVIGDVDGNGIQDVIYSKCVDVGEGVYSPYLVIRYGTNGTQQLSKAFGEGPGGNPCDLGESPTLADIDDDGVVEIVFTSDFVP